MTKFNISEINLCTESEGPGRRLVIWFQGCDLSCLGCSNPKMRPLISAHILSIEELSQIIFQSKEKYDIEGVTYIGGEPTLQIFLPLLSNVIQTMGLGLIAFTGKRYEDVADILQGCDLVIDGPYIESQHSSLRRIIGSDNQRLLHLTDRYKNLESWFFSKEITGDINVCGTSIIYNGNYLSAIE